MEGMVMKIIDAFFGGILEIEEFFDNIECLYEEKKKYIRGIFVACVLCCVIFAVIGQVIVSGIVLVIGILIIGYSQIADWRHSARKLFVLCVINNVLFSGILVCWMQGTIESLNTRALYIGLYLIIWGFLSIVSEVEVSLLVNEIVSGVTTTIFTIGTFLISMKLKGLSSTKDYETYFQSEELFVQALENNDIIVWNILKVEILELFEVGFIALLPIIGLTALCVMIVKVKKYWLDKRKESIEKVKSNL